MTDRRDEDEVLRALWRGLAAPDPEDADDQARDPQTKAAMDWMLAAWDALEAPAPPAALPGKRLRFAPALAAVAAVLMALVGALAFDQGAGRDPERDRAAATDQADLEEARTLAAASAAATTRRVTAAGELEFKKGRFRLLLVRPTPRTTAPEEPKEN